jgi:hypothetical protein
MEDREKSMPLEFVCKCGMKYRVDIEKPRPGVRQVEPAFYKHCSTDEERIIPGRIIQVWEEH